MTARPLDEWIGSDGQAIPPRVKVRIALRQEGRCDGCRRKFDTRLKPEFDHRPALINGGENRESKIVAVCSACHSERTADDISEKSYTYRHTADRLGIDLKPKRKWGTWR